MNATATRLPATVAAVEQLDLIMYVDPATSSPDTVVDDALEGVSQIAAESGTIILANCLRADPFGCESAVVIGVDMADGSPQWLTEVISCDALVHGTLTAAIAAFGAVVNGLLDARAALTC